MYINIIHKKESNLAICDNVDEPEGPYAKWEKPDTGRQILPELSYILTKKKSISDAQNAIFLDSIYLH